jgi:hypothetical protein
MLSLWVLVAAFAGLAGWAAFISVRLYRGTRGTRATPGAHPAALDAAPAELAEDEAPSPHPVA